VFIGTRASFLLTGASYVVDLFGRDRFNNSVVTSATTQGESSFAAYSSAPLSRQHDIPQNLPIAVGLALPDGEKTAAIDRQFAVLNQSDLRQKI
jgi:hypothetical protein